MTGPADELVRHEVDRVLHRTLSELGVEFERPDHGAYLAVLPGEGRPTSAVWLIVGQRALQVECFFLRRPEVNRAAVYNTVLARNVRSYGVHFATDALGDVYLVGQLPFAAVDATEIDRVLGQVVTHVDEAFEVCVRAGFTATAVDPRPLSLVSDGAGRRIEGTPDSAPHRDARR